MCFFFNTEAVYINYSVNILRTIFSQLIAYLDLTKNPIFPTYEFNNRKYKSRLSQ